MLTRLVSSPLVFAPLLLALGAGCGGADTAPGASGAAASTTSSMGAASASHGEPGTSASAGDPASDGDAGVSVASGEGSPGAAPVSGGDDGGDVQMNSGDSGGGTAPAPTAGPVRGDRIEIPVTVITDGSEEPVVLVDVSIGGSPSFKAIVDTGAAGLRIADGVVPDSAWTVTTTALKVETFPANHDAVSTVLAKGSVVLGGVSAPTMVSMGKITGVTCMADTPTCVAAGTTGKTFRFRKKYVANFGIGMKATDLASPLAAIAKSGKYILSLPKYGTGSSGQMIVDPNATDVARFLAPTQLDDFGKSTIPGVTSWNDSEVPFCLNGFCDVGLFDTGAAGATVLVDANGVDAQQITGDPNATQVPAGTHLTATFNGNSGYGFTVMDPPTAARDLVNLSTTVHQTNLGLMPFLIKDVLYDYEIGTIAFTHKM